MRPRNHNPAPSSSFRLWGGLLGLSAVLCGCAPEESIPHDAIKVGLLLPFTGTSAANASNFERAALYAADRIEQAGGVRGRPLVIVARDTHSSLERSRSSARALIEAGVSVVIGPESAEIALEIMPMLIEHNVSFLSPLVGAANDSAVDCTHPWFRLAPSARALGEALARQLSSESVQKVAVLHAAGAYNEALSAAVISRFRTLGGSVDVQLEIDPSAQSYGNVIALSIAANVDAIVLATSPRTGALLVNEFQASGVNPPRWFLSPLLKTDLLVQNVAPEALEGAVGVAPSIYDTSQDFPNAFAQRWGGDEPLEGAYFYYDALGLVALALEKSASRSGEVEHLALEAAILDAAAPPGEAAGWNDLELALQRVRDGDDIYYSGLTGPMLLQACGPRRLGATTPWRVKAGRIVND